MRSIPSLYNLLRGSLITLPYFSYLGLAGLGVITLTLSVQWLTSFLAPITSASRRSDLDPIVCNGLWLLTGVLIVSCFWAENRGEAFLQLTNFLPFFLFFAVVPSLLNPAERLAQIALDLVVTSIPINLIALGEYILRSDFIPRPMRRIPWVDWVRDRPHYGRATVMFNHPNALASYLVMILGLGLGLILYRAVCQRFAHAPFPLSQFPYLTALLYLGTGSSLVGVFCSGSRNGLVIAVLLLISFGVSWGWFLQISRQVGLVIAAGVIGLLTGSAVFGIGGRSLLPTAWADDPRLRLWSIALDLWRDRPWWGWGLGNYKFQFSDRLLRAYPDCLPQRSLPVIPVECADVVHPHNFWLMLLADGGIFVAIGFTLWVGYICFMGVRALLLKRLNFPQKTLGLIYLFAFTSCLAFALFDITLYDARVNALNWMALAGIYCLSGNILSRRNEVHRRTPNF